MEKIIYLLWSDNLVGQQQQLAVAIQAVGAKHLRINVADEAVASGAHMCMAAHINPLPHGIITFWLASSFDRQAVEQVLAQFSDKYFGYSVCESEPIVNTKHPASIGQRTEGFNQVVFLQKPEHFEQEDWLDIWLNSHTRVAIDTQQTFGYRQNIVVRRFDKSAPKLDAIIEENFLLGALTDDKVFYAADIAGEKTMVEQMIDSCVRFIDFNRMNRLITSEYNY